MELIDILQMANDANASDVLLVAGMPPVIRTEGAIKKTELSSLSPTDVEKLLFSILNERQIDAYRKNNEVDITYNVSGVARFRVNVHKQRGSVAAALRRIPLNIPNLDDLGVPKTIIKDLCRLKSGLVLVTGQTGSGKTTTLAAMLDFINSDRACHIITIEDPIEFLHPHKKSVVEQREVYNDIDSFSLGLRNLLRQDPDVVLVGEMRDLETISASLSAAEAGQLVLATLHTSDASESMNRIIDVFPTHQQQQIRTQLATTIKGVLSQILVPKTTGKGRALACEMMVATPAIRNLIRDGHTHQIPNVIETGAKFGMRSMDKSLLTLYDKKIIDRGELLFHLKDKQRLEV
ncbi:MAG: PilT/PilU family type 4a pilus ATPase [Candidatus Omnitrophota bacterium]